MLPMASETSTLEPNKEDAFILKKGALLWNNKELLLAG
jgi:hypothetical protein